MDILHTLKVKNIFQHRWTQFSPACVEMMWVKANNTVGKISQCTQQCKSWWQSQWSSCRTSLTSFISWTRFNLRIHISLLSMCTLMFQVFANRCSILFVQLSAAFTSMFLFLLLSLLLLLSFINKAGSHQESKLGPFAWATSALPLSYDNQTTTSHHSPLFAQHKWY